MKTNSDTTVKLYIGLDVHKEQTSVAVAEPGTKGEIVIVSTMQFNRGSRSLPRPALGDHFNARKIAFVVKAVGRSGGRTGGRGNEIR